MAFKKRLWTSDPDKFMRSNFMRRLSRALRTRRETIGLSQDQLAFRTGLHRSYISDVECGGRNISLGSFYLLSAALEILPSQLLIEAERAFAIRRKRKKIEIS